MLLKSKSLPDDTNKFSSTREGVWRKSIVHYMEED